MTKNTKIVILLIALSAIIAIFPLTYIKDSEFSGADGEAEDIISEINPEYEAWADPIMEPPGGETESLLFCLQAALGAGIFGYGFGTLRTKHKYQTLKTSSNKK
jgi:ABC-type cobalt transport system, periplasmic component